LKDLVECGEYQKARNGVGKRQPTLFQMREPGKPPGDQDELTPCREDMKNFPKNGEKKSGRHKKQKNLRLKVESS